MSSNSLDMSEGGGMLPGDVVVKTEDAGKQAPSSASSSSSWVLIKSEIQQMTQKWKELQRMQSQGKRSMDELHDLSLKCKRDIAKCLRHIARAKNGEPIRRRRKDDEDENEFGKLKTFDSTQAPPAKRRKSSQQVQGQDQQQQQQQQQQSQQLQLQPQQVQQLLSQRQALRDDLNMDQKLLQIQNRGYMGQDMNSQYAQYQQQQQQQQQQLAQAQMAVKESPVGGGLKPGRRVFVYSNNDKNYILAKVMSYDKSSKSYMVIDADKDSRNNFMVSENYVTPLPRVPLLNLEPGTRVMALYHPSTCFYPGVITQKAQNNVNKKWLMFFIIYVFF